MKNEDFKKIISGIEEKIGKDNSAIIADDLGTLISDNLTMNKTIEEKNNTITEKEKLNEKLVFANSSLLQQVGVPGETPKENKKKKDYEEDEDGEPKISWNDCFDKKRKFLEIKNFYKERKKKYVTKRFKKFFKQNQTNKF